MKKVVLMLFAFLFLGVNQAFAYRVTDFSSDAKIVEAVRVLEQAGETDVCAHHNNIAMSKIDKFNNTVNHCITKCYKSIDASQR